jgi:hypothetical protein
MLGHRSAISLLSVGFRAQGLFQAVKSLRTYIPQVTERVNMSSERGEVYLLREDDDEWVRPTPASTAIVEAVTEETDLDESDLDDATADVEWTELAAVLEGEGEEYTFTVEGHEVSIDSEGNIALGE